MSGDRGRSDEEMIGSRPQQQRLPARSDLMHRLRKRSRTWQLAWRCRIHEERRSTASSLATRWRVGRPAARRPGTNAIERTVHICRRLDECHLPTDYDHGVPSLRHPKKLASLLIRWNTTRFCPGTGPARKGRKGPILRE